MLTLPESTLTVCDTFSPAHDPGDGLRDGAPPVGQPADTSPVGFQGHFARQHIGGGFILQSKAASDSARFSLP